MATQKKRRNDRPVAFRKTVTHQPKFNKPSTKILLFASDGLAIKFGYLARLIRSCKAKWTTISAETI
jgi:hypothetical protein